MALDPVPWMIGGGQAVHSAEVARLAVFGYAKDANGVILPTDLLVRQTSTPGSNVRVAPGGAMLFNSYPGGAGQSYILRNATETQVAIPATGSGSGATRYVIAYVSDPQYGGTMPADPAAGPYVYIGLVSTLTGINYPYVPLAKIVQPASTATITTAMITDLRECAQPRRKDVWYPNALVAPSTETLTATATAGEYFPNAQGPKTIAIPKWATRVQIRCEWLGVRYGSGNAYGEMWVEFGPYSAPSEREQKTQKYQFDTPAASNVSRANWIVVDEMAVPKAYRGTDQLFVPKARRLGGVSNTVQVDAKSGMNLSVRFLEVADQDI